MTAAVALGRVGVETLVVERTDGSGQAGVGLALQNSPLRALARVLERAAAAVPGVQLRYGVTVTAIRDEGDRVAADLDVGTTAQVDLVVGADGIHSVVRGLVFPDAPEPRRARQVIWRAGRGRRAATRGRRPVPPSRAGPGAPVPGTRRAHRTQEAGRPSGTTRL